MPKIRPKISNERFIIYDLAPLEHCEIKGKIIAAYSGNPPYWSELLLLSAAESPHALKKNLEKIREDESRKLPRFMLIVWANSQKELERYPHFRSAYCDAREVKAGKEILGTFEQKLALQNLPGRSRVDEEIEKFVIERRDTTPPNGKQRSWQQIAISCNEKFNPEPPATAGSVRQIHRRAKARNPVQK